MERPVNVYYRVVNSENSMTELLCNFMAYKPFRNLFLSLFLHKVKCDTVKFDDFQTQFSIESSNSRPDMTIINEEFDILIEVKTGNADLTDNQPSSYLKHLIGSNKTTKMLVFLVPLSYKHLNVWEIRAQEFSNQCRQSNVMLKTVFWEDFMRIIERSDLNILSERVSDFYDLLRMWYEMVDIKFNHMEVSYMYNKDIPILLTKLFKIVDEVANKCGANYKVKKSVTDTEYAIYIKNQENEDILYFGVWYDFWEEHGVPLCFGVDSKRWKKELVSNFSTIFTGKTQDMAEWRMTYIDRGILSDTGNCAEKIVEIIQGTLEELIK